MASDPTRGEHSPTSLLALLLLLSLGLRLGWGLSRPVDRASIDALPDQREYLSIARNLLDGNGLEFVDPRFARAVYAFRMPGYPLFVAACGAKIRVVRVVQAIIDTFTVLAVFLLARKLTGEVERDRAALLAAALVAANPYLVYFSGLVLSETVFAAILAWAMVLLTAKAVRGDRFAGTVSQIGGLLALALSVLVRPSAIGLPVLLGALSAYVNRPGAPTYQPVRRRPNGRPKNSALFMGLVGAFLILLSLLPWAWRNQRVLGRWIWLDTNAGFTLYDGYNPGATGASRQSFVAHEPGLQDLDEVDRSQYLAHKAEAFIRSHPARVIELMGAKLMRTWSPAPLSKEYGKPGLELIALAYSVPFDILMIAGLLWGRICRSAKVFLLAPAIYLSVVHALTIGSLRYRIPAEPLLAVIAAGAAGLLFRSDQTPARDS